MAVQPGKRQSRREELIKAGIEELSLHGVTGFSIRHIADVCGVSCAAPAKHFGDKNGFIAAIIDDVNLQWYEEQRRILGTGEKDTRTQIVDISVGYVKFLVEHPYFRSILMLKDEKFDNLYHKMRGELSSTTQQLVQTYCEESSMDAQTRCRKLYVVRALIYGAALMFDNGEMTYTEQMIAIVRASIDREFSLP